MLLDKVKELAKEKNMTIAELERKLNFSQGSISRWIKQSPSSERLQKVADYFEVSTDYLLGRSEKRHYYDLTEKDKKNIARELEEMIADLKKADAFAYSKEATDLDIETHELLIASLENTLRIAKIEAKKRYTPKKYRD